MIEPDKGIITFWNAQSASTFYVAIGGRLFNGRAARSVDYPYSIFWQHSPGRPEYFLDGGADQLEYLFYQFDIWSRSSSPLEALQLATYAMALLDNAAITVTGYSLKKFERVNNILLPPEGDDNDIIQHYMVEYDMVLEKN
ncbi:MAG: DUF3168 domain-containing protein [Candidatus Hodarchaeales archaeon]|jgi:hypothetical protein